MINKIINEMITYFNNDVKRINHALKVYGFANAISSSENLSQDQSQIIGFSAILHDIGIKEAEKKHNSSAGKYQEIEGPPIARQILKNHQINPEIIERVCFLIGNHHSYQKIDGIDFQILVEADFLVNIFEDNIDKQAIYNIKSKYFKTQNALKLIESMYF